MSSTPIHRGLAGVIADTTDICDVTADGSSLTYRGYLVDELAAFRTFEEVAYLLWHGELPDADALGRFRTAERSRREVSRTLISLIDQLSGTCHAMDVMRTAVSLLGAEDPRQAGAGDDFRPVELFARVPVIVAHDYRRRRGLDRIPPCPELGYIENFFQMCFGQIPSPEAIECFELSMILYAEHSFNASTFSARVVASTGSDIYSAVTAAVRAERAVARRRQRGGDAHDAGDRRPRPGRCLGPAAAHGREEGRGVRPSRVQAGGLPGRHDEERIPDDGQTGRRRALGRHVRSH
jgi:citrate synthase